MMTKAKITSEEALAALKEGNARFVGGNVQGPNRSKDRRYSTVEQGQSPIVTLVSCSDSRVPPEILFDQGIGDIFSIRVAGNICGMSEMGTIEYGVEHLHIPLLTVMGHTHCGAVTAVVQEAEVEGNLLSLAQRIAPAVKKTVSGRPGLAGQELVDECAKENVFRQIETLIKECSIVRNAINHGMLTVVGSFYDLQDGDVNWLGKHPEERTLVKARSFARPAAPQAADAAKEG